MNNNKALGLFRPTDRDHQKKIENNLNACFDDLYGIIEGVRENVARFECLVDRICFGASYSKIDVKMLNDRLTL